MQDGEQTDSRMFDNGMSTEAYDQTNVQPSFHESYDGQKYGEPLERDAANMVGESYYQMMDNASQVNAHLDYSSAPPLGIPIDATEMQAAAIMNQTLFYNAPHNQSCYSQYSPMFNETNPMYNVSQYYGGMPMGMNPYYDPYGIINPLASAALAVDKPKKKIKKFLCC